jgi:CrcB protein
MPLSRGATAAAVFAGGALGAVVRWLVSEVPGLGGSFPYPTLIVNVAGAAGLGYLAGVVFSRPGRGILWPFLGVGLAGALTTFSTFVVEAVDLLAVDGPAAALWYAGGSVLAGLWLAGHARELGSRS